MSSRPTDGKRIAVLVEVLDAIARGEAQQLGDVAARVFGWSTERVFLAIEAAMACGLIAKSRAKRNPRDPQASP